MRTLKFLVDIPHASRVNETLSDLRRLRVSAALFAAILAAAAVGLAIVGNTALKILAALLVVAAVGSLYLVAWLPRKFGDIQSVYDKSALVPAVIAAIRPRGLTLLALVNLTKDPQGTPQYALVPRRALSVPDHERTIGERVPCAAVAANRNPRATSDHWDVVRPMPIAWGARDTAVIRKGLDMIPYVEWNFLADNITRVDEAEKAREGFLRLRPDELPPQLRGA